MTTTTDTPNITTAKAFLSAVINGKSPEVTECRCESVRELLDLLDRFNKSLPFMAQKGKPGRVRGINDISRNGFTVHVAGHVFQVNPPGKASSPKKVTATSKKAYRELDRETLAMRVARAVIELHKEHAFVYDKLVADKMGIDSSTVSARRNEISDAGGIRIDGDTYSLHLGPNTKNPITGKTVQGWALRKPNTLF
jgi:hypothetical protein